MKELNKQEVANKNVRLPRNMNETENFGATFDDMLLTAIKNFMDYNKKDNPSEYTKDKSKWDKEVRMKVQRLLGLRKPQFETKFAELINQSYITETETHYVATNNYGEHHYYDLPKETTMGILNSTVKKDTIKVYICLLGWYNSKRIRNEKFTFSYSQLCEMVGISKQGKAVDRIKDITILLEQLGLIKINPIPVKLLLNGIEADFLVLDYATGEMDLSNNGAFKASQKQK